MFLDFLGCVGEIRHTLIFIHVVVFASVFLALYSNSTQSVFYQKRRNLKFATQNDDDNTNWFMRYWVGTKPTRR